MHTKLNHSLPDKGQEFFSATLWPDEVNAVMAACWTHDVTTAAALIPLAIMGDAKTGTEETLCSEKEPRGFVFLQHLCYL